MRFYPLFVAALLGTFLRHQVVSAPVDDNADEDWILDWMDWTGLDGDEDLAERNVATKDGLTLEEFNRLEREAEEFEGPPEEDPNFFEGDIMPSKSRNADSRKRLWPNGVVPYEFDRNVDQSSKATIRKALSALMKKVNARGRCITIRPKKSRDKDYIHVTKSGGCRSYVGREGEGSQTLKLKSNCYSTGTIQHEFIHALGFWHEQSRKDRDRYITILWKNIDEKEKQNFDKKPIDNLGFPYDYDSVMHYRSTAFSKNKEPTILVKKPGAKIGQRDGASNQDVAEIRKLYGC